MSPRLYLRYLFRTRVYLYACCSAVFTLVTKLLVSELQTGPEAVQTFTRAPTAHALVEPWLRRLAS